MRGKGIKTMTKNIMIVGVGGQGTLLTSRIIGRAALAMGYDVKISEVYKSETGFAVKVLPMGFDNTITMMVGVDLEGKVTGIAIISHTETAGLGAVAADKGEDGQAFRGQFVGKSGELAVGTDIDAISSATITSKAVTEGVNMALKCVDGLK